jgi:hypothetical protein
MLLVAFAGQLLGAFTATTAEGLNGLTYRVSLGDARWVEAAQPAPRSWFRLGFEVPAQPLGAAVFVDAAQDLRVSVNGKMAQDGLRKVTSSHRLEIHSYHISPLLVRGYNVLEIWVVNHDTSPAALRARLSIKYGEADTELVTGQPGWLSTSDVKQVQLRPVKPAGPVGQLGWSPPRKVPSGQKNAGSRTPEWLTGEPLSADVITSVAQGNALTAWVGFMLPGKARDAWIRVAATGAYAVTVNGHDVVISGLATHHSIQKSWRPATIQAYRIAPFLRAGENEIVVRTYSRSIAMAYLDGRIETQAGTSAIHSGAAWTVSNGVGGAAPRQTGPAISLGRPAVAWGADPLIVRGDRQTLVVPWRLTLLPRMAGALAAIGLCLLSAWLVTRWPGSGPRRRTFTAAAAVAAFGFLPAAAAVVLVEQVGGLPSFNAPGPYTAPWALALLALAPLGMLVGLASPGLGQALKAVARRLSRMPPVARVRSWTTSRRGYLAGLLAIALGMAGLLSYDLGYEPYWQDELSSLDAAVGMRAHLIPTWPSGFVYWKAELYSATLAVVGLFSGDSAPPLRAISVVLFALTVVAFGLLLVPRVLKGRHPALWLAAAALFATAPAELAWAREVRMYQMAQLFFVIFLAVYLRALQAPTGRRIALSAVALVLMYLSHEESFVVFPAVAIIGLVVLRGRIFSDRRWLVAGGLAAAVIGLQYVLAMTSHPPIFGYDHSNRPFIEFDTRNAFHYVSGVYFPVPPGTLAAVSALALVATAVGVARRSLERLFLATFLWTTVLVLSFLFTPLSDRYTFITMPSLFLLGSLGLLDLLDAVTGRLAGLAGHERAGVQRLKPVAFGLAFLALAATMPQSTGSYGLAFARLTGSPVAPHHIDYQYVATYMRLHQRPGDLFITICPPNIPAYYLGRAPDMVVPTRAGNRLLYLFEKDGRAVDTEFGVPAILSPADLQHVLDTHSRIWLVTDQGRPNRLPPGFLPILNQNFRLVDMGVSAQLYLYGSDEP